MFTFLLPPVFWLCLWRNTNKYTHTHKHYRFGCLNDNSDHNYQNFDIFATQQWYRPNYYGHDDYKDDGDDDDVAHNKHFQLHLYALEKRSDAVITFPLNFFCANPLVFSAAQTLLPVLWLCFSCVPVSLFVLHFKHVPVQNSRESRTRSLVRVNSNIAFTTR